LIELSNQKIATWYYGPLLKAEKTANQEDIIKEFLVFLKNNGIIAVENAKTQKYFPSSSIFDQNSGLYSRIGESPFIDIRNNLDEVIKTFDRSVRKNCNKCERAGVEVEISEDTTLLEPYTEMLIWFRSSKNFGLPTFFPNADTLKIFNSPITSMGIAMAKLNGHYLAGMGFVTINNIMTEIGSATSKEYETEKLPVNEYLKIKAIEFYKQKGISIYDLAGGEKNPSDPKKQNILAFKQKFTVRNAPYGIIDRKILSPAWYANAVKRKITFFLQK
jgi:lipid II:glycine glycyltransferase (peptidoglycan interpeptide bridge formation enzyme)